MRVCLYRGAGLTRFVPRSQSQGYRLPWQSQGGLHRSRRGREIGLGSSRSFGHVLKALQFAALRVSQFAL